MSAAAQYVQVATDGSGKKIQVFENTVSASTVEAQAVVLVQSDGTTYAPTAFSNLGANTTLNVKATTGNVFSLTCHNANAASRYLQLHDTATTPSNAAVPKFSFLVPTASQIIVGTDFFTVEGVAFATGIAFAFSTTRDTYTAGSAGDQATYIQYK